MKGDWKSWDAQQFVRACILSNAVKINNFCNRNVITSYDNHLTEVVLLVTYFVFDSQKQQLIEEVV